MDETETTVVGSGGLGCIASAGNDYDTAVIAVAVRGRCLAIGINDSSCACEC